MIRLAGLLPYSIRMNPLAEGQNTVNLLDF